MATTRPDRRPGRGRRGPQRRRRGRQRARLRSSARRCGRRRGVRLPALLGRELLQRRCWSGRRCAWPVGAGRGGRAAAARALGGVDSASVHRSGSNAVGGQHGCAHDHDDDAGRRSSGRSRTEPQQRRRRLERRPIEHEVAVARDHVVDDLARRSCPASASRAPGRADRPRAARSNRRCVWFWQTRQRSSSAMRVIRASSAGSASLGRRFAPRATAPRPRAAAARQPTLSASRVAAPSPAAGSCRAGLRGVHGADLLVADDAVACR